MKSRIATIILAAILIYLIGSTLQVGFINIDPTHLTTIPRFNAWEIIYNLFIK